MTVALHMYCVVHYTERIYHEVYMESFLIIQAQPSMQLTSDEALETARELWERDKYKQNAAIQRSYATILQEFCQQEKCEIKCR